MGDLSETNDTDFEEGDFQLFFWRLGIRILTVAIAIIRILLLVFAVHLAYGICVNFVCGYASWTW